MLKLNGPVWTREDLEACRLMMIDGLSNEQIAKKLHRSKGAIARKRYDLVGRLHEAATVVRLATGGQRDVVLDNRRHLIDLMRSYKALTLGEAKAKYRSRNELDVPEGYNPRLVNPWRETISMVGSQFADTV